MSRITAIFGVVGSIIPDQCVARTLSAHYNNIVNYNKYSKIYSNHNKTTKDSIGL